MTQNWFADQLADRIRQWIADLPVREPGMFVLRACQEFGGLPLVSNHVYLWIIKPDGSVWCMDHEAFGMPVEPETSPRMVYIALAQGARRYPELSSLLPAQPDDLHLCGHCKGIGWLEEPGGSTASCLSCSGLGWV